MNRNKWMHRLNPLHVYCRLEDMVCGMMRLYDRVIYRKIFKEKSEWKKKAKS